METFIYTIAILYKNKNYTAIGYLTTVEWIIQSYYNEKPKFKDFFYHYDLDDYFKRFYSERDNKNYFIGTSKYWMEHINVHFTQEEFACADVLLANLSVLDSGNPWFPKSYIFANKYRNKLIYELEIALKSDKLIKEYLPLFDCDSLLEFEVKYNNLIGFEKHTHNFGYLEAYDCVPFISYKSKIK